MVQPVTPVELPYFRLYVLEMLALLADTERRELRWFTGLDEGAWVEGIELIWDFLVEDHHIDEAVRLADGTVFMPGEEARRLESCGQLFVTIFERCREEIRRTSSWGCVLSDPEWSRLVAMATDALVAMVSNWGFPKFEELGAPGAANVPGDS